MFNGNGTSAMFNGNGTSGLTGGGANYLYVINNNCCDNRSKN